MTRSNRIVHNCADRAGTVPRHGATRVVCRVPIGDGTRHGCRTPVAHPRNGTVPPRPQPPAGRQAPGRRVETLPAQLATCRITTPPNRRGGRRCYPARLLPRYRMLCPVPARGNGYAAVVASPNAAANSVHGCRSHHATNVATITTRAPQPSKPSGLAPGVAGDAAAVVGGASSPGGGSLAGTAGILAHPGPGPGDVALRRVRASLDGPRALRRALARSDSAGAARGLLGANLCAAFGFPVARVAATAWEEPRGTVRDALVDRGDAHQQLVMVAPAREATVYRSESPRPNGTDRGARRLAFARAPVSGIVGRVAAGGSARRGTREHCDRHVRDGRCLPPHTSTVAPDLACGAA